MWVQINKSIVFVWLEVAIITNSYSQTDQIVQDGSFEGCGGAAPTTIEQINSLPPNPAYSVLEKYCDAWLPYGETFDGNNNTPDLWTTLNYSNALLAGCPIDNDNPSTSDVINAQPKIFSTPDGVHFAGCGNHESMANRLSRKTYRNSEVKISFWFNLRSTIGPFVNPQGCNPSVCSPTYISAQLNNSQDQTIQSNRIVQLEIFGWDQQPLFTPCEWHYFESDWLNTGSEEYDEFIIGGLDPNISGDFYGVGYVYYDDIKLWNGRDCCPDIKLYEATDDLPSFTHVENYIKAGYDVGIPNISGDVIVKSGQEVLFRAGNYIELLPGFSTEPGAKFVAEPLDCTPFSNPVGDPINIPASYYDSNFMDYFLLCPGVNNYTVEVSGADHFEFTLFAGGEGGGGIYYESSGPINNNFPSLWDGTTGPGNYALDDVYDVLLIFSNCDKSVTLTYGLTVKKVTCKQGNDATAGYSENVNYETNFNVEDSTLHDDNAHVKILDKCFKTYFIMYPNPTTDKFILQFTNVNQQSIIGDIVINNVLGMVIYQSKIPNPKSQIDLSFHPPGLYFVKVVTGENVYVEKIILK